MSGRLAEVDEDVHLADADESTTMRTVSNTDVDDLKHLSLIWRVKMTQIRMMEDRGYHLTPLAQELKEKAISPADFWDFIAEKVPTMSTSPTALWDLLTETYTAKRDSKINNLVVFLPLPTFGTKAFPTMRLNKIVSVVKKDPTIRFLDVIYEFPMTKTSRSKLADTNRVVAQWSYPELLMPILNSVYLAAQFRVIPPAEFNEYYKADPVAARAGLPALCRDDPLVRYHQWTVDTAVRSVEVGDVNVAVTRLYKDYIVTPSTIFAAIDSVEQPTS